jgi:hypothetical protein
MAGTPRSCWTGHNSGQMVIFLNKNASSRNPWLLNIAHFVMNYEACQQSYRRRGFEDRRYPTKDVSGAISGH